LARKRKTLAAGAAKSASGCRSFFTCASRQEFHFTVNQDNPIATRRHFAVRFGQDAVQRHADARLMAETAAHYSRLRRKYEYAASHPWLSTTPDPPPPEPTLRAAFWADRRDYGRVLAALGEAIQLAPRDAELLRNRAWLLATCPDAAIRNGKQAIESATRACEETEWEDAAALNTLAAACAETGNFRDATKWQENALAQLPKGDPRTTRYRDQLKLFRAGEPYRSELGARVAIED
jgi:tetratricopeptide (TPR) repeat protein